MLTAQSAKDFSIARSQVLFEQLFNLIAQRPGDLLSFEEVRRLLGLHGAVDRGLREIELDSIVGSAGKSHDFTRRFRPKRENSEDRWRRVDELFYNQGFAPIEVNQVGDVYFVTDGHHRISVNRTHNVPTIEAFVKEYPTPVTIDKDDTLENIRRKATQAKLGENGCSVCNPVAC